MKYKPFYSNLLVVSSLFYLYMAIFDYSITMGAYEKFGDLFFRLENNPYICDLLKLDIPPLQMLIIPLVIVCLSYYARRLLNQMHTEDKDLKMGLRLEFGFAYAICTIIVMGISHLIGFISWFYYGAF